MPVSRMGGKKSGPAREAPALQVVRDHLHGHRLAWGRAGDLARRGVDQMSVVVQPHREPVVGTAPDDLARESDQERVLTPPTG